MNANVYHTVLSTLMLEWFRRGPEMKDTRYGQFVINSGKVDSVIPSPCPDVYYETDHEVALHKLVALGPEE